MVERQKETLHIIYMSKTKLMALYIYLLSTKNIVIIIFIVLTLAVLTVLT